MRKCSACKADIPSNRLVQLTLRVVGGKTMDPIDLYWLHDTCADEIRRQLGRS